MRKKSLTQSLVLMLAFLVVACKSSDITEATDPSISSEEAPEGVVQLDPLLPTGVHLQAALPLLDTVHNELRYLVYLPPDYGEDPDREWPMILYLHGRGDADYDSTFVLSSGLPAVLLSGEQPVEFPFVVISPQAFPGEAWRSPEMISALGALLGELAEIYKVDSERVYLTGFGMGGHGSWWLANAYPERFAAMASISGSGYQTPSLPEQETPCRLAALPIWAIHGAQDRTSDASNSQMNVLTLQQECDVNVKWTLYEDEDHIGAYERAYRDPALYEWMLEHSR